MKTSKINILHKAIFSVCISIFCLACEDNKIVPDKIRSISGVKVADTVMLNRPVAIEVSCMFFCNEKLNKIVKREGSDFVNFDVYYKENVNQQVMCPTMIYNDYFIEVVTPKKQGFYKIYSRDTILVKTLWVQ